MNKIMKRRKKQTKTEGKEKKSCITRIKTRTEKYFESANFS